MRKMGENEALKTEIVSLKKDVSERKWLRDKSI